MSEQEYGQVCDCCEERHYPLHQIVFRAKNGQVIIAWVCDDCLPAYAEE